MQFEGYKPGGLLHVQFPNGMSLTEGVERSSEWWDEVGRIIVLKSFEESTNADDANRSNGDGIMRGLLFDQLNTREQHKVVSNWYENIGSKL